jgi:hypothetical protein
MTRLDFENPRVTIRDKKYHAELGVIVDTFLGTEDHGIFTFNLELDFNSAHQSYGNVDLVDLEILKDLMVCVGVDQWEGLRGKRVYALREEPYGLIKGILSENKQRFHFYEDYYN